MPYIVYKRGENMSKDKKEKQKAVNTAEQKNDDYRKVGGKWIPVPPTVPQGQPQTPTQPAPSEPESEYTEPDLTQHPNAEISELAKSIQGIRNGMNGIRADSLLTDAQKNLRINAGEADIKAKTLQLRDKVFLHAIGNDLSIFLNLIKFRAGQMFQVNPEKLGTFLELVKTTEAGWKDKTVAEQMVESDQTIMDAQSEIVHQNEIIRSELVAQAELMEHEFIVNPVKVAVSYPDQLQKLVGKQYVNATGKQAVSTGTSKQADIQLGDKEGVPDADHKEMLSVTTKDNVQEAINSGVDAMSNVDIAHWLAINKLGRDMPKFRHTIASSIYVHRKSMGYA